MKFVYSASFVTPCLIDVKEVFDLKICCLHPLHLDNIVYYVLENGSNILCI